MPDVYTLQTTLAEPYVFVRGIIDAHGGKPITTIDVNGRSVSVGQEFTPTLYWLGRHVKLTEPVYLYEVEDRWGRRTKTTEPPPGLKDIGFEELDPYIMPKRVLEERQSTKVAYALAQAIANKDVSEISNLAKRLGIEGVADESLPAVATYELKKRGVVIPRAEVRSDDDEFADLRIALELEDYNEVGKALKALDKPVPPTKAERFDFAQSVLSGEA